MRLYGLASSFSVLGQWWPASYVYISNEVRAALHKVRDITLSLFLACLLSAKNIKCGSCMLFNSIKEVLFVIKITEIMDYLDLTVCRLVESAGGGRWVFCEMKHIH